MMLFKAYTNDEQLHQISISHKTDEACGSLFIWSKMAEHS